MLWIGFFASTARVNETVARVVTAAKNFCGSYDSCLKSDGARFTVELTGVIRIVSPSGLALATNSLATMPRRVAILGGARIPFARANTSYVDQGNLEMMSAAMKALVEKYALRGEKLGEVSAGAVIKHSRDWNLARESTQSAGLDPQTPAYDVQRACGTSLTAVSTLASRIALGEIDSAIAGG